MAGGLGGIGASGIGASGIGASGIGASGIKLIRITDEAGLRALLAVAVADTSPEETMPPVDEAEPGWNEAKQIAFLEFFRPMVSSDDTVIFTVVAGAEIAGFTRLTHMPELSADENTAQTGMWLGRSHRGKGVGAAAFEALLGEAARRGYARVVADTTPGNVGALGVLRRGGARTRAEGGKVYAEIAIAPGYAADLDK